MSSNLLERFGIKPFRGILNGIILSDNKKNKKNNNIYIFKDEKFNLDSLTFNLANSIERISEIAEIFYRYRFNSKIYDVETDLDLKVRRVDIQFIRSNQSNDTDASEFLEKSKQTFLNNYKDRSWAGYEDKNTKLQSLALGDRNSSYYLRIYTIHSALKFELEIKNKTANSLGLLLLNIIKRFLSRF